jgi:hypothetical protein
MSQIATRSILSKIMANNITGAPESCNDVDLEKGPSSDGDEICGLSSPTATAVDNLSLGKINWFDSRLYGITN